MFRHRPLTDSEIARRAAELVEHSRDPGIFWDAHVKLMTRSESLTEDDLVAVANDLRLAEEDAAKSEEAARRAKERVDRDERSAHVSGVTITPTFFINGRRYDGPWDANSLADAMLGRLGHRVSSATIEFASWGPSAGVLLLLATLVSVVLTNSPLGPDFEAFWQVTFGVTLGDGAFRMPLEGWVNDGLLTVFFLVVGLEIKREFTVGRLSTRRSAALPVVAALGGMIAPAALYLLVIPHGLLSRGWGVPMPTDTAFALAIIVMLGRRVPVELRVFLTAAAIVDDIGAIAVVAVFYSGDLHLGYLAGAAAVTVGLALLNRAHVYRVSPYLVLGVVLWVCIQGSGLHATLAGVILALFIPTRPPANLRALMAQANTIINAETRQGGYVLRHGPSVVAMRALDSIHDRLESPTERLLRHAGARSSYAILPLFALANAGVEITMDVWTGDLVLLLAIGLGLVVGKPIGLMGASALAVWTGVAVKPKEYSWRQLMGASALAGIGFTMSLLIASLAFPNAADFAAAKIAIFLASVLAALVGVAILWNARQVAVDGEGGGPETSE